VTKALHVSPHPDDEVLGAGGTLGLLQRAGWTVVNVACSLGRPDQHDRRLGELRDAAARAQVDLMLCEPLLRLSADDDLVAAERQLVSFLAPLLADRSVALVIGPHPYDRHHAHEAVGRGIARALELVGRSVPWWSWGLWGDLTDPNLYVPLEAPDLLRLEHIMEAYPGENRRNDYRRLLTARATVSAVLGSELVFGYGRASADPAPYAEVLSESTFDGRWIRSAPRVLREGELRGWHDS
jgi:LmbE family N-acetylglucosaminyl deacetylase